jgi:NADH:ubiquinone oxidoreductase subunit F (NADH-binding)/DMSO/TMAO reductase YedYZ heme-binding membrane subunit
VTPNYLWYSTRGAGIVSLILFTLVVVLGILTASRWQSRSWPRFVTAGLHRSLALSSLIFLVIHIVTAVVDPFTNLGWSSVVLPFSASYRQIFLGLGSVALYLLIALIATSLVRDRIGLRAWRAIHWAAYAFWPVALVHGIGTGSDASALWMRAINGACISAVVGAAAWRLWEASSRQPLADLVPAPVPEDWRIANPAGFRDGPRLEAGSLVSVPSGASPTAAAGRARGGDRLLGGPVATSGTESYADHRARLGRMPFHGSALIPAIEAAGLLGRGGAGFPVGRKWRSVAERSGGHAVVVANGAEGKSTSRKDQVLMSLRPHLVLDGELVAANAVGADEVVMYIGTEHRPALDAMARAIREREREFRLSVRLVEAPLGYVVGESSAAVNYINTGDARPTMAPPRTFEQGVGGRPTVVSNVESLAYAALIARHGPDWYRAAGRTETRGTALVTVSGTTPAQRVVEIEYGTPLGEVLERVGAWTTAGQGVMLGDSFGAWADVHAARDLPLDPAIMKRSGLSFGAGVIAVLPATTCGVLQTAEVMAYMAGESAGQCGPCVYGLNALAETTGRLAHGWSNPGDLERLDVWGSQLAGRGACAHPDGAMAFLHSGLRVFADEFAIHARGGCSLRAGRVGYPAVAASGGQR